MYLNHINFHLNIIDIIGAFYNEQQFLFMLTVLLDILVFKIKLNVTYEREQFPYLLKINSEG